MHPVLLGLLLVWQWIVPGSAFDIKCKVDLRVRNTTLRDVMRTYFTIYSIENNETLHQTAPLYSQSARLDGSASGEFTFKDVPVEYAANKTVYYTLHSHSQDFNLKPNRILLEISGNGLEQEPTIQAFENKFGKEYFPSPDVLFPETLKPLPLDPDGRVVVTTMNKQPLRQYVSVRNLGILQSGPIASVLNSKFKMAGVITVVLLIVFPLLLEKFDPETAKAMRQEKLQREGAKYASK